MRRAGQALLAAALLAQAASADAYVRSRSEGCRPLYWAQSCIYIQPDSELTKDMMPADVTRIIQSSINQWQSRTTGSFLKMNYLAPSGPLETRFDGQPAIKFRTGRWCRPGDCAGDQETCHDRAAAGITTVFYVNTPDDPSRDGLILDADIELNAVNDQFYDADKGPSTLTGRTLTDLENTLVHELGHLQGLDHTCRNTATPSCVVDEQGKQPPLCDTVKAGMLTDPKLKAVYEATMFASAGDREISKRTLEADDISAINGSYPSAKDPKVCDKPEIKDYCAGGPMDKGCAVAPSARSSAPSSAPSRAPFAAGAAAPGLLLLLAIAARLLRRTQNSR